MSSVFTHSQRSKDDTIKVILLTWTLITLWGYASLFIDLNALLGLSSVPSRYCWPLCDPNCEKTLWLSAAFNSLHFFFLFRRFFFLSSSVYWLAPDLTKGDYRKRNRKSKKFTGNKGMSESSRLELEYKWEPEKKNQKGKTKKKKNRGLCRSTEAVLDILTKG